MKNRSGNVFIVLALLALLTLNLPLSTAHAQGTAFTYQGQLQNNGSLASGTYNLQFTLYTNATGGTAVAGPVTNSAVGVTNGLFTAAIDFGSSVWNGETNWLQIGVETNGGSSFTLLSPLQQLTPVPYAIYAGNATMLASGAALGSGADNSISSSGAVDSFIGGGYNNTIQPDASYSAIGGGEFNAVQESSGSSVIGGGYFNIIYANAETSMIGGGLFNQIYGDTNNYGTGVIVGGYTGVIYSNSWNSFIGGGGNNTIGTGSDHSVIVGGFGNTISGKGSFIGGGGYDGLNYSGNQASGNASVVGGGLGNVASNGYATVAGGAFNSTSGGYGTVSGGSHNSSAYESVVAGGTGNNDLESDSAIGGGQGNVISGDGSDSAIGGGNGNNIDEFDSFIGGGQQNVIEEYADHSVIGGGTSNVVVGAVTGPAVAAVIGGGQNNVVETNAYFSVIGGGFGNMIQSNAYFAMIPGGTKNVAGGLASFAAGTSAQATNNGAFVWSDDSSTNPFSSTTSNQLNVRAMGGVRLVTGGTGMTLDGQSVVPSGNYVFAYSTTPQNVSSPTIFQNASFNNEPQLNGWIVSGTSQFQCIQTGLYLIQYTAEATIQDSLSMRGALNSTEIPGSQAYAEPNTFSQGTVISKTFLASVSAGGILTIQYTGNSSGDQLQGGGSGSTVPSLSLTITRIQ
jgi:hypothetical protein